MKKGYIVAVVLVFAFALVAQAASTYQELFFRGCVEKKIAQCQRKSDLATSQKKHVSAAGIKARDQLIFFQNNKERLVNEMVTQEIPMSRTKVDYFLIRTYTDQTRGLASTE